MINDLHSILDKLVYSRKFMIEKICSACNDDNQYRAEISAYTGYSFSNNTLEKMLEAVPYIFIPQKLMDDIEKSMPEISVVDEEIIVSDDFSFSVKKFMYRDFEFRVG